MSTISASTTTTTGTLVLQTGSTPTTAVTISSAQIVTFSNPPTATGAGSVATNTAFGLSALAANTTGSNNSSFGVYANTANTTGLSNTAIGSNALYNSTGSHNTALGVSVLGAYAASPGTGSYNVAVGNAALGNNTTASGNTVVGYQAGYTQTTAGGGYNTYIGYYAGRLSTSYQNVFIGSNAGENSTGANNTFLGVSAGASVTSGNNNTIIGRYNGNQSSLDIRTASNYIVLSDGDGVPRIFYNSTDKVMSYRSATAGVARHQQDGTDQVSVANGSTITISSGEIGTALICLYDNASGIGAMFFANYYGGTYLIYGDPSSSFATADTAGKACVYKSAGSHTCTFKNNTGGTLNVSIAVYAAQISA